MPDMYLRFTACYESKVGRVSRSDSRRLISYIQTKLFTSSEVPIFEIFSGDSPTKGQDKEVSQHLRSVMDDLVKNLAIIWHIQSDGYLQGLSAELANSSIFTGEEEMFAWARCCSRLVEMGGADWGVDRFS
jgi:protein AFG1